MKQMKQGIYLIFIALSITSCASMKMTDLKPTPKNNQLLPTLEPRVDLSSFESAYTLGSTTSNSAGTVYGQTRTNQNRTSTIGIGSSTTTSTSIKDPRIQDAITIFDRDVKDNITDPFNDTKGVILCKINASNPKVGYGWSVLSGFTLMIPNLLGMPIGSYKMSLDVEVEIYNNNGKLIGRYNAQSKEKTYMALYWGYGKDAARVANIKAFREALNIIKKEISNDYEKLVGKLEE